MRSVAPLRRQLHRPPDDPPAEAIRLLMLKNGGGVSTWHDGGSSVKPQNCLS
jgi:hypothetical protein